MTELEAYPNDATFVSIDIAMQTFDVLVSPHSKKRYRLKITNDRAGHDQLIRDLEAIGKPVVVGFEATGNYHRTIAWRLLDAGFTTHLISSVALARTREAMHNSWDKNDPKDAQVMLHLLQTGQVQRYIDPMMNNTNDWQELSKTHEIISKNKTETLHRLKTHYWPLYFPEIDRFRHGSRKEWFFKFLYQFPIPASITALSKETFAAQAAPLMGRKVRKNALIGDIYATAQESSALPVALDSAAVIMYRIVIMQMCRLIQSRDKIEQQANELLGGNQDFVRLQQIPGIGPIHAMTILAEAGNLRRFGHHRQFLKYCGFDLATHQSGQFRGQSKISKYGNARLRKAFWMAGQVAVKMNENSFKDKYLRYTAKDRDDRDLNRKAYTAVAAKVARVAYSVIKHETDYRPFYGAR